MWLRSPGKGASINCMYVCIVFFIVLNLSVLFEDATNLVFFLFVLRFLFYAVITVFFHGSKNICWTIIHGRCSPQRASNYPSRLNWFLIYHFAQWRDSLSLSPIPALVSLVRQEVTKHALSSCHHCRNVNPEPYTLTVVRSLFDTHPSYLAGKWERLEAVHSSCPGGNISWHKFNTVIFWWWERLVNKSNNSLSSPPSVIRSSNTINLPFGNHDLRQSVSGISSWNFTPASFMSWSPSCYTP